MVDLNPRRQRLAKEYARTQRRLGLAEMLLSAAYLGIWLATGMAATLGNLLAGLHIWLRVAALSAAIGAPLYVVTLPLAFYRGYTLPHKFEQGTQSVRDWWMDQLKGLLISVLLGGFVLELLYGLLAWQPLTWWLWLGAALLLFNVLLTNLAPLVIVPLFFKMQPLGVDFGHLQQRLLALAARANARVRGVYTLNLSSRTKGANAALMGIGNTRRIVLGDTLLQEFTADEIETVMAHELGHHVNRDIPSGILVGSVLTLGGLYVAHLALQAGMQRLGLPDPADPNTLPLLAAVLGIYQLLTGPLENAYSRWRERRADVYALQATANGPAYASALTRLANQNLSEVDPPLWVEALLYSHPALKGRIALALAFANAGSQARAA